MSKRIVGGTLSWRGDGRVVGFHSLQCIRSTARLNVVSENWENIAGPGDDPNRRRQSIVPISSVNFVFRLPSLFRPWRNHVKQHLVDISGVVCRRR